MKINWKQLAQSKGYKSLKASYTKDVQEASKQKRPMRDKAEFLELFNWVISRAKHYAYKKDCSVESVLDKWEEGRSYWWLNYYQACKQPKLHNKVLKLIGVNGNRKYYKKWHCFKGTTKRRMCEIISNEAIKKSTKVKKRWIMRRKKLRRGL